MGWIREGIHGKMKIIGNILFLGLDSEFVDIYNSIRCYNFIIYIYTPYFLCISNIIMKLTYNF